MNRPRRLTGEIAAVGLVLSLAAALWLALRIWPVPNQAAGCVPPPAIGPAAGLTYAPTAAPATAAPIEAAQATSTAATPEGDYATQAAGEQATIIARATDEPFPTAAPAVVQSGQPSIATARRGGLSLEVRLPKDAYLDGEAGQADATLTNAGPETIFVEGGLSPFAATLLDAQGREPLPWPWWPLSFPGRAYLQALAPGQAVTGTITFHVVGTVPNYAFWVETRFSRASPVNPQGPDNVWLRLEAGPVPLRVLEPAPAQRLQAQLQADRLGWRLRVTNAAGQAPTGPLVGALEAASANSFLTRPLADNPGGAWSAGWGNSDFGAGPFVVRAWESAPGYVTAVVTQAVEGTGDAASLFATAHGPDQHTFATLDGARAALRFPLYRPGALSAGAALDSVRTETSASTDGCWITVRQMYHLPNGAWLELEQFYIYPPYAGNWGEARDDRQAQAVSVSGQPGYLIQRFGWRILDWKVGRDGFELRAPIASVSLTDLLAVAASVQS
jgi:hypothetical protein